MTDKELQVKEKQEAQRAGEPTKPMKSFVPPVDIYETEEAVTVIAEMPGVCKECAEIGLEGGVLTIKGWVNREETKAGVTTLLREFEIGAYTRRFEVGEAIDQSKIEAKVADGILTITLPKVEPAKPRKIEVRAG